MKAYPLLNNENIIIEEYKLGSLISKLMIKYDITRGRVYSILKRNNIELKNNTLLTIEQINNQLKSKNIVYADTVYYGSKSLAKWQCLTCGNILIMAKCYASGTFIKCQNCQNIASIKKAFESAEQRGGICLTKQYTDSRDYLDCQCKNGHNFKIKYANLVSSGQWCPKCSDNTFICENICRVYFETLFGEKFIRIRPDFLKKENGYNLELDGFCEKLKLAFEHNGEQHYAGNPWNDTRSDIDNDVLKIQLCRKNEIKLIIIPSLFKRTMFVNLRKLILFQCNNFNINVPFPDAFIDLSTCYDDSFDIYKSIAINKGGKCLSPYFLGATNNKLIWECQRGHQWIQYPYVIKKGHWCPVCAGQPSKNIIKSD